MATEISNIAALFSAEGTKNLLQTAKDDKVQDDFSMFMNLNAFGQNAAGTYIAGNDVESISTTGKNNVTAYDQYQYKDNTCIKDAKTKEISPEQCEKAEKVLQEFAEEVKSVLEEELSVSEEQIANAMAALGMNFTDLLDTKNLAGLVAELTGCEEPMQLLMTDAFQNILNGVEEISEALLEELGMSKEEFIAVCDELVVQDTAGQSEMGNEDEADVTHVDDTVAVAETKTQKDVLTTGNVQTADDTQAKVQESQTEETTDIKAEDSANRITESENPQETGEDAEESSDFLKKSESGATEKKAESHGIVIEQQAQPADRTSYAGVQQTTQTYVDTFDVIEQITEYMKVLVSGETTSLEMQLNPENLGKIYIHVSEKAGTITAQISATNENVREALQAQVADLKTSLNQQGIKVEAVDVTVESHEFEQNLEENAGREQKKAEQEEERRASGGRRNINLNDLDSLSGIMSEEESLAAKIMQENGNQMDIIV